ncbi:unnamed protein product, partial [Ectocarpus sp. 6 AP-2014]
MFSGDPEGPLEEINEHARREAVIEAHRRPTTGDDDLKSRRPQLRGLFDVVLEVEPWNKERHAKMSLAWRDCGQRPWASLDKFARRRGNAASHPPTGAPAERPRCKAHLETVEKVAAKLAADPRTGRDISGSRKRVSTPNDSVGAGHHRHTDDPRTRAD